MAQNALPRQLRRAAALPEPGLPQHHCQTGGDEVERHAGHDLVAAIGDDGKAMDQREQDRDRNAGQKTGPRVCCQISDAGGSKGRRQHLAFKTDIEHAGAFGKQPRKSGKEQRDGEADGRAENADQHIEKIHVSSPFCQTLVDVDDRGPVHIFQRAGKQDHQTLNDHDHLAGNVGHLEGKIRAALIENAEQQCREDDP